MAKPENPSAEVVIRRFDELYKKYKFMEYNLSQKKKRYLLIIEYCFVIVGMVYRLKEQIPEIETSLATVATLQMKQKEGSAITTNYMLSDGVYASAEVPYTETVMLWLGVSECTSVCVSFTLHTLSQANVMLEYPISEGVAMLTSNLSTAKRSLSRVQVELDKVKDQITTIEVDMARVYNWDVQERRKAKAVAAAGINT